MFLHSSHLQSSLHLAPAPKHSQYFFWQLLFLQLQPFNFLFIFYLYVSFSISLLFNYLSVESFRILIQNSIHNFVPLLNMSLSIITSLTTTIRPLNIKIIIPHKEPEAKQSQYSFKHFVFLQLQVFG